MLRQLKTPSGEPRITGISPLNQIQHAEAETIRRVAAARENARQVEIDAQEQTMRMLHEAQAQGRREGQAEYEAAVAQAKLEAQQMRNQALQQTESLRHKGESFLEAALNQAVAVVTGMNHEAEAS